MKKLILLFLMFSFCSLNKGYSNLTIDTIPIYKKNERIQRNLTRIHKRGQIAAKYLSSYSINDFTKNQLDSFLLALNSDRLVNPYLILSTGLWQMDHEDVHQRLCSFITLDTLDYSGKWGENRRLNYNDNEWAARLALARLGYPYHIDFIENIFKQQSVLNQNTAGKFVLYTRYINKKQITNSLLELALKDHCYSYFDWQNYNMGGDSVSYYLSAAIMSILPIDIAEKDSYPRKRRSDITDEDIAQFKEWIINSKGEDITLKEDSLIVDNGHFLSFGMSIWPNAHLRELRSLAAAQQTNRGTKDRPHINYNGACYFEGDTIFVNRQQTERMWLMAWQKEGQIMGEKTEWKGVSDTDRGTYARVDKTLFNRRRPRLVRASCSNCGGNAEDISVEVYIVGE